MEPRLSDPSDRSGPGSPAPAPAATTAAASLANAVINLTALRDQAKRELIQLLDSVPGKKGLVLDPKLSGPLGLVVEVPVLKEHGVEKIYHLAPGRLVSDCRSIIYLVRPRVHLMKQIVEQIRYFQSEGQQKRQCAVYFVPRRTLICERMLDELAGGGAAAAGVSVWNEIKFGEYRLELIAFDDDLLSLELPEAFRECFLDGDRTSLFYVARSILRLQQLFGIIPRLKAKGSCSKLVVDMLLRMRKEASMPPDDPPSGAQAPGGVDMASVPGVGASLGGTAQQPTTPEIDQLILIDRDVDLVTPLLTQLTYEGLIDEVFGISNGLVEVDPELAGQKNPTTNKKVKIPLNGNDKIYDEIRNENFSVVAPLLNRRAKQIDEYYKERHGAQTVSQIRDFMKRFASTQAEHNSLRNHTNIAERIVMLTKQPGFKPRLEAEQMLYLGVNTTNDYIEQCINKKEPLLKVMRLLCLQSLTNGGFKPAQFDFFKRELIQTYGYELLFTLNNLEKLGLFKRQDASRNTFAQARKQLSLIVEDIDESNPTDIAYVYSGYAPLSVRIVQQAFKSGGWRAKEDALKLLPGPLVEEIQPPLDGTPERGPVSSPGVTLVYFIGGVTFAEIAALRWLSKQEGYGSLIIATTKLISGNTLLDSVFEDLSPKS
eukprot:TRINITY_DN22737_c0_g1_i1.p1 TRINITY_DN22737_c0_g1~~TRINITY_DN22737_c0_g1_i1.p1  ORF type:complete len:656 (-),score=304.25 TRINITY_DN22737_c0_g1_i1:111-2078(-)